MEANEFETILKGRFTSFRSTPAPEVWQSVASNLDGKKKRRGIFWIIPVFLLIWFVPFALIYNQHVGSTKNNLSLASSAIQKNDLVSEKTDSEVFSSKNYELLQETEVSPTSSSIGAKSHFDTAMNPRKQTKTPEVDPLEQAQNAGQESPATESTDVYEEETASEKQVARKKSPKSTLSRMDFPTIAPPAMMIREGFGFGREVFLYVNTLNRVGALRYYDSNSKLTDPNNSVTVSYARNIEIGVGYKMKLRRWNYSADVFYSHSDETILSSSGIVESQRNIYGLGLGAERTLYSSGKFALNFQSKLLGEIQTIKSYSNPGESSFATSSPYPSADATNQKTNSLQKALGLQVGISANYRFSRRMYTFAQLGYRNYLLQEKPEQSMLFRSPSFIVFGAGISYSF